MTQPFPDYYYVTEITKKRFRDFSFHSHERTIKWHCQYRWSSGLLLLLDKAFILFSMYKNLLEYDKMESRGWRLYKETQLLLFTMYNQNHQHNHSRFSYHTTIYTHKQTYRHTNKQETLTWSFVQVATSL